mmetsp:Transcript_1802/g.6442  ORF Transcript_1802/g.6442 Transcript_1802/m.6442 type:complete len:175 (+) Transcript_1802:809-1333(+)
MIPSPWWLSTRPGVSPRAPAPTALYTRSPAASATAPSREYPLPGPSATRRWNHRAPPHLPPPRGAGAYATADGGGCGATGDGDVMMRFLPCYQAVESMRLGASPKAAAEDAIARMRRFYPDFVGAVVTVSPSGEHAGATTPGWGFRYAVRKPGMKAAEVVPVLPANASVAEGKR